MSNPAEGRKGVRASPGAGTPFSFPPCAGAATLESLEFGRVLAAVAERAVGPLGAARVRRRYPVADLDAVHREIELVGNLADRLRGGDPFRPDPVPDIGEAVKLLVIPGTLLHGPALVDLGRTLEAIGRTALELDRLAEVAPPLGALRVRDLPPTSVGREILRVLEPDGTVADGADRAVDRARTRVRDVRAQLLRELERTLRALDGPQSPDAAVTVRDGRYVIPVPRDFRRQVPGIVHEESASRATLFVEPAAAVELGNALAAAQADEIRAVRAVYRRLGESVREHLEAVREGWAMCIRVDDLYARARYAVDVGAVTPRLHPAPGALRLVGARHPLLVADAVEAVPFDLLLDGEQRGLVVSGPNTGGKTVLLKTVGLACVLVQAGVIPPVGEGSALPVFSEVLADIGDRQSIAESLSTFSAHLAALRDALERADDAALVLFDEIGAGTDPDEGGALAGAAIEALIGRGARVVATTHLTVLKQLATQVAGVVNASLQFDAATLTPTYRLTTGVPGRSYGLVIARRLGLPDDLLRDAEQRTDRAARELDTLLADAEARAARLAAEEAALAARMRETDVAADTVAARARAVADRERALVQREKEQEREARDRARQFLLDARKRVEDALSVARAAVSEATAKEARRLVEQGIAEEGTELERLQRELAEKGWAVKRKRQRIRPQAESRPSRPPLRAAAAPAVEVEASTEIDLRGLTVIEARDAVQRAVDAAVLADLRSLRVIHGKGTGALRAAVAEVLAADRRVSRHRLAPPPEGGTGVTIAELGG